MGVRLRFMAAPFTPLRPGLKPLEERELRLRRRIDALIDARARKEARILVLEQRNRHLNRRLIELSEELREARRVA